MPRQKCKLLHSVIACHLYSLPENIVFCMLRQIKCFDRKWLCRQVHFSLALFLFPSPFLFLSVTHKCTASHTIVALRQMAASTTSQKMLYKDSVFLSWMDFVFKKKIVKEWWAITRKLQIDKWKTLLSSFSSDSLFL